MPMIYLVPSGDAYYILSDSTARSLVASGEYSFEPPYVAPPEPEQPPEKPTEPEQMPEPILLKINEADSAALIAIDGIGAVKARAIIQAQPNISSVEILREIVPDFNWDAVTQGQQPVTIAYDATQS